MLATEDRATGVQGYSNTADFKNKGDHREYGNYRGILMQVIARNIMAKIVQKRFSKLAEKVLTESQCGV